jgi:hypothetical protein
LTCDSDGGNIALGKRCSLKRNTNIRQASSSQYEAGEKGDADMGHSRLCSFDCRLISGTKEYQVGIESIRQAKSFLSQKNVEVNGFVVDKVVMWPQSARAKRMVAGKDFLLIEPIGHGSVSVRRMNVED